MQLRENSCCAIAVRLSVGYFLAIGGGQQRDIVVGPASEEEEEADKCRIVVRYEQIKCLHKAGIYLLLTVIPWHWQSDGRSSDGMTIMAK